MNNKSIFSLHVPVNAPSLLFLIGFLVLLVSCEYFYSKDKYLRDYNQFVTNLEDNVETLTTEKWEEVQYEYEQFNAELYNKVYSDLTPADQQQVGKIKARYNKVLLKYQFDKMLEGVENGLEQLKGVLEH